MTQPDEIWALVERRAVSSVRGVSAEDNDEMMRVALAEAPMNPHRQSGGAMASNSPGMMPPMMMGGGAGGREAGGSGGLGGGGAMSAGGGGAGPTLASQATAPAGSLREVRYVTGGSGGGAVPATGGSAGGHESAEDVEVIDTLASGSDSPAESSAEPESPDEPDPEPGEPRGRGIPRDGFIADPQAVTGMAVAWNELKTRLGALDRSETEARLGLVEAAVRPQQAINDLLRMWLDGAVEEAGAMESKLRQAVKDYAAVDDEAIADIRRELSRD